MKLKKQMRGFTIAELLIVIVIVGILATWAFPSFRGMYENARLNSSVNRLTASIGWARAEAVRAQTPVVLTPVGGSWGDGWTIFLDANGNGVQDGGENTLRDEESFPSSITVANSNRVSINPSGMITPVASVAQLNNGMRTVTVSIQMNRVKID